MQLNVVGTVDTVLIREVSLIKLSFIQCMVPFIYSILYREVPLYY